MPRLDDRIAQVKADITAYQALLDEGRRKNARTAAIPMGGTVTRYSLDELEDLIDRKNNELDRLLGRKQGVDIEVNRVIRPHKIQHGRSIGG